MKFNKKFQVYNKLQGLTGDYYSEWYGNSKEIKFSRIIFIEYCNYFLMVWIQNVYYVKINLFSTYVHEMSIKCLKKNCHENCMTAVFDFISLHITIFNAPQERND